MVNRTTFVVNKLKEYNLLTPERFRGFLSHINSIEVAMVEEKTDVDVENSSIKHRPIYTDSVDAIIDQLKQGKGISAAWRLKIYDEGGSGMGHRESERKYYTTKEAAIKDINSHNYDFTRLKKMITVVDNLGKVCPIDIDNLSRIYLRGDMDENFRKLLTERKKKQQKLELRRQLESQLEKELANQKKIIQLREKLEINNN